MKDTTGNEDQRYVSRADHDKARKWFERSKVEEKRRHQGNNIRRLRAEIEKVTEGK